MTGYQLTERMRKKRRRHPLSATEQALYNELAAICNEDEWKDVFTCSNDELRAALRISENTLNEARKSLVMAGLLYYKSGKSKRIFGTYSFTKKLTTSNFDTVPSTSDFEVDPDTVSTTSNFDTNTYTKEAISTSNFDTDPDTKVPRSTSKFEDYKNKLNKTKTKQEEVLVEKGPNGLGESRASPKVNLSFFNSIEKTKVAVEDFIRSQRPEFIEPYVERWNLFAEQYKLPKVSKISDSRRRKFKVRIQEPAFDFLKVLEKAGLSEFILQGKWFGFDWILENQENYLKTIEGSYDSRKKDELIAVVNSVTAKPVLEKIQRDINYFFETYLEGPGRCTVISLEVEYYNRLKHDRLINFSDDQITEIRERAIDHNSAAESNEQLMTKFMKLFAVLEYFEQAKREGKEVIYVEP